MLQCPEILRDLNLRKVPEQQALLLCLLVNRIRLESGSSITTDGNSATERRIGQLQASSSAAAASPIASATLSNVGDGSPRLPSSISAFRVGGGIAADGNRVSGSNPVVGSLAGSVYTSGIALKPDDETLR